MGVGLMPNLGGIRRSVDARLGRESGTRLVPGPCECQCKWILGIQWMLDQLAVPLESKMLHTLFQPSDLLKPAPWVTMYCRSLGAGESPAPSSLSNLRSPGRNAPSF